MTESAPHPEHFEDPLSNYDPQKYESRLEHALAEEQVLSITMQPWAVIPPTTTVRDAIAKLNGLVISCLLIEEDGTLLGIITERDVLERIALQYEALAEEPVSKVMTRNPFVVYGSDPAGTALAAIAVAGYRHVPVLDSSQRLMGVISPQRVFDFMARRM